MLFIILKERIFSFTIGLIFLKQILLAPISLIYGIIVFIRNWCYSSKIIKESNINRVIISVGNLSVGGTGKTPHVEYLINLLSPIFSIATLSRGYKRKTKGFVLANPNSTCEEIGDEPLQYSKKFNSISVAVCENRVEGANKILEKNPNTQVILLDDAFQHRKIARDINILITD